MDTFKKKRLIKHGFVTAVFDGDQKSSNEHKKIKKKLK